MTIVARNKFLAIDSDRALLPRLEKEGARFDLILTDPPYNLKKDFGNRSDHLSLDDFLATNRARIEACTRLLAPGGSLLWFGIHKYIGYLQVMMYESGLHYRRLNIWRYQNGFSRSSRSPRGEYEPFLWFSKSATSWTFNADAVRVPYKSGTRLRTPVYYKRADGQKVAWTPNPGGAMRGDIWEFPTLAGKRFAKERTKHPTQKPAALITELLKAFSPIDGSGRYSGKVLDPFAGVGTLGVCCELLNREGHRIEWVSGELEARWVDVSNQRVGSIKSLR